MKVICSIVAAALLLSCCKKNHNDAPITVVPTPAHPAMQYTDLHNEEANYQHALHLDLDGDGNRDISFGVMVLGDPILQQDIFRFFVSSPDERFLLQDAADQAPVFAKGSTIGPAMPGLYWYPISFTTLADKIIPANAPAYWQGNWKNAQQQYLPFYMFKGGQRFYGWVQLSVNTTTEKIILHKAAYCKEANKEIKAGS